MKTIYVEQTKGFGLGNFINLTPTIKALSKENKIEVWFNDAFIRDCFLDCPFMTIIPQRKSNPLLTSGMINLKNDMPDYVYVWKKIFGNENVTEHTYIDQPHPLHAAFIPLTNNSYATILNGSGSLKSNYIDKKNPTPHAYNHLLSQLKINKIFIGTNDDILRGRGIKADYFKQTEIRSALALIKYADLIISNDSGLAHAAGAMNKQLYILWKDTWLPKNLNPGKNTTIIRKNEWASFNITQPS